jgi:hypothetical protein
VGRSGDADHAGKRGGVDGVVAPALPAAATRTTPALAGVLTALATVDEFVLPDRLIETTSAPWSAAQVIPEASADIVPAVVRVEHLDGMTEQLQQ